MADHPSLIYKPPSTSVGHKRQTLHWRLHIYKVRGHHPTGCASTKMESHQMRTVHLIVWHRWTTWNKDECVWVFWQWSSRNVSGPQNYREESPVTSEPENVGRRPCWFVILPSVLTKLEPLQNEVVFMFWHFHIDANRSRHGGCSGRPDVALGARLRD